MWPFKDQRTRQDDGKWEESGRVEAWHYRLLISDFG